MYLKSAVVERRRIQLRSVNADDLLNRLMGLGIAREMPDRPGIKRSVRVNKIEVSVAEACEHAGESMPMGWTSTTC